MTPFTKGRKKHTNFFNEVDCVYYTKPNVDRQNNFIIGIAVGVMVVACGIIYVVINVNS